MSGSGSERGKSETSFDKSRLRFDVPLRPSGSHQRNKGDIDGTLFFFFVFAVRTVMHDAAGTEVELLCKPGLLGMHAESAV